MKVLFVCSINNKWGRPSPFVVEQADSLVGLGHQVDFFGISRKGIVSYLRHIFLLKRYLAIRDYDVIHAHFVWSAFVAVMQRKVPVVVSFLGCDLNKKNLRFVSKFVIYPLAKFCIVMNRDMQSFIPEGKSSIIQFGIDLERFRPMDRQAAKAALGFDEKVKYVLFASTFNRVEKNSALAKAAVEKFSQARLIEFSGFTKEQIPILYSAVDVLLMTSIREGSPQVIKEAMACNCPIVSTDVGDVKWMLGTSYNCCICSFDAEDISDKIRMVIGSRERSNGRERIAQMELDLESVAEKISAIYHKVTF